MKKIIYAAAAALFVSAFGMTAQAADITADVLTYNGQTKTAQAEGSVVINDNGAVMTGSSGEYHFEDKSSYLTGGVHYQKDNTSLTAATVYMSGDKTLRGVGGVVIHDGDRMLSGDTVTYNPDTGYGLSDGNSHVETPDGTLDAPHMEGNLKEIRIDATGGVHITSEKHQLVADGDTAVYTKSPNADDGHIVLSGDATANQNGNTITGPELDISLRDNTVETQGRSTLVITNTNPQ